MHKNMYINRNQHIYSTLPTIDCMYVLCRNARVLRIAIIIELTKGRNQISSYYKVDIRAKKCNSYSPGRVIRAWQSWGVRICWGATHRGVMEIWLPSTLTRELGSYYMNICMHIHNSPRGFTLQLPNSSFLSLSSGELV